MTQFSAETALAIYGSAQRRWVSKKGFRDPYLAIIIASLDGRGVNLTAEDCRNLADDCAVATVASNHCEEMLPERFRND